MAVADRLGIAAVFAADTDFEFFTDFAAFGDRNAHQRADPVTVDADKGIFRQDTVQDITRQEFSRIVARQTETGLRQIVGPEGEKLRLFGDFIGHHAGPWQLDHRADRVAHLDAVSLLRRARHSFDDGFLLVQLGPRADQWDHHFGERIFALAFELAGSLENR